MVPRGIRTQDDSRCGCCSAGVDETIRHALFECSAHDKVRDEFLERATGAFPQFGGMSAGARLRLVLSEDTPRKLDSLLYRFLTQVFASRERGLVSGPARAGR